MAETEQQKRDTTFRDALLAAGHTPKMEDPSLLDDGETPDIDWFAVSWEHHNGPECVMCGWSACQHCVRPEDIPMCEGPAKKKRDLLRMAESLEAQASECRAEAEAIELEKEPA